jgi:hypothetical protein
MAQGLSEGYPAGDRMTYETRKNVRDSAAFVAAVSLASEDYCAERLSAVW